MIASSLDVSDRLVLGSLTSGAAHGQRISSRLCRGKGTDRIDARAVYAALHRLERRGFVRADWRPAGTQVHHAKYYRLTSKGWRGITDRPSSASDILLLVATIALVILHALEAVASGGPRRLAIVVDSPDRVTLFEFGRARLDVLRILGAIGIDVDWPIHDRTNGVRRRPIATYACFVVHVIVPAGHGGSSVEPLGAMVKADARSANAVIFEENVLEFARVHHVSSSLVLGLVITHEIGHSLLPAPAHSTTGIMQTPWDTSTMQQAIGSDLRFTSRQAAQIRDRLDSCQPALMDGSDHPKL